ncbi:transporter substrate-binding domain-containing protein [Bradyrhizobium sp. DASA03007]|uniref:transporter substrate-binding domain-containing protein n=1 Tax=unclassified Bradyrhizobium TaxID=2631580 RepID=UPI003F71FFF6
MCGTPKLSFFVLLLTLAGYSFPTSAQPEDRLLASLRKDGKITVALTSVPPFMIMSPSGEATGASVDLQNMVLKNMGLPALTPVLTDWAAMIPGLQVKQFDYIGAGWNITEALCKTVVFSAPYYATQAALFVLAGNPKHLTGAGDVARRSEIKLAVVGKGSPYEQYALKQGVKPEQIIYVPDIQAGVATVTGGRADAYIVGQFSIPNPEQKGLEAVVDERSPVYASAFTFRKENAGFRDAFNERLIPLIRNGTMDKLYEKYGLPNWNTQARLLANLNKASDVVPSCE